MSGSGVKYHRVRMESTDLTISIEAAALAGTNRVTINAWIKSGRCIGVSNLRRGFKLPRWQFEPAIWPALQPVRKIVTRCSCHCAWVVGADCSGLAIANVQVIGI